MPAGSVPPAGGVPPAAPGQIDPGVPGAHPHVQLPHVQLPHVSPEYLRNFYVEQKPKMFEWVKETRADAFGYDEDLDDFHELGMDVFPMKPTKTVHLSWLKFLGAIALLGIVALGTVGYLTGVWGNLQPLGPLIGTEEATATPTPTPTPTPETPAEPAPQVQVATANTNANMRENATENSAIIGRLNNGAQAEVTGELVNGWVPINYGGQAGFVWGGLVDIEMGDAPGDAQAAVTEPGEEPEFDPEFVAIPAHIRNGTNLRPDPSINNQPIRVLPRGAEITVIGDARGGWVPVEVDGQRGYVAAQNVDTTPPADDN